MCVIRWLPAILLTIAGLLGLFLVLHTIIRLIRHFYKFPMPEFAANIIDNPLRRRIQPPDEMPLRHGVKPGMRILEVGPGNGTYTIATARALGAEGRLITIDIEPKMIDRVKQRIQEEGIHNIEARVADVFDLPFEAGSFDLVYMIAVIGEIPSPHKALEEFHKILKPGGSLAFSEILMDPDYPLARNLIKLVVPVGFSVEDRQGSFFSYSLIFKKNEAREKQQMSDPDPQTIVLRFNEAINTRDLESLASLMTEDHTFIDSSNEIHAGKEVMVLGWEDFFESYPDYQNHFEHLETRENEVFILGHSTCSHEVLDGPAIWTARIVNGLVAEWRVYLDMEDNRRKLELPLDY